MLELADSADVAWAKAWADGVGPDDAPALTAWRARQAPAMPVFAALATLATGDLAIDVPSTTRPDASRGEALLLGLARAWRDACDEDPDTALHGCDELALLIEAATTLETPSQVDACLAWIDLALGDAAARATEVGLAERRWRAASAATAPVCVRMFALTQLAAMAARNLRTRDAYRLTCHAIALAEEVGREQQASGLRLAAAGFALTLDQPAAARQLLAREQARAPRGLAGTMLAASVGTPREAVRDLAAGLTRAAAQGDHATYAALAIFGARRYLDAGLPADAIITLTAAAHHLTLRDAGLAEGLRNERARLTAGMADADAVIARALERLRG